MTELSLGVSPQVGEDSIAANHILQSSFYDPKAVINIFKAEPEGFIQVTHLLHRASLDE
ncbi:unnamed protein product [marine sediment metagenome]|uniref:Uncharacterized protein n=1 Tax=marine sediment metagenome TaxID=412755 RepID=X1CT28_9ZZZZ